MVDSFNFCSSICDASAMQLKNFDNFSKCLMKTFGTSEGLFLKRAFHWRFH